MGDKYEKDGKIYEKSIFGDREIGKIEKASFFDFSTTDHVVDSKTGLRTGITVEPNHSFTDKSVTIKSSSGDTATETKMWTDTYPLIGDIDRSSTRTYETDWWGNEKKSKPSDGGQPSKFEWWGRGIEWREQRLRVIL
jgi:hypothetical protein